MKILPGRWQSKDGSLTLAIIVLDIALLLFTAKRYLVW
jgi:hypothetical protein